MINKNKNLVNKFPHNWEHPLNRKFESIVYNISTKTSSFFSKYLNI